MKATLGSGLGTKKQVMQGEAFDVPVVQPPLAEVIASGNVVAGSGRRWRPLPWAWPCARARPSPISSTPEAVRKMLLAAKSISYPDAAGGAAASVHFNETLKKMGLAEQLQPKIKLAKGGAAAMAMVAKGEVEIGLTFVSEMRDDGIDIGQGRCRAPFPRRPDWWGMFQSHAKDPAAAKALLEFLSSPDAAAVYQAEGMQPGR